MNNFFLVKDDFNIDLKEKIFKCRKGGAEALIKININEETNFKKKISFFQILDYRKLMSCLIKNFLMFINQGKKYKLLWIGKKTAMVLRVCEKCSIDLELW